MSLFPFRLFNYTEKKQHQQKQKRERRNHSGHNLYHPTNENKTTSITLVYIIKSLRSDV